MEPLVSILIPVYNAEKWLGESIRSALAQTWQRKEVIVVDDGSTDNSVAVARGLESATIKIIEKVNSGSSSARNRALREAQGDYIQYLDADDILARDKVAQQLERLHLESPDAVSTSAWERFYCANTTTVTFSRHPDYRDYEFPIDWLVQSWSGKGTMPPIAWLLPRSVVERVGWWNEGLSLNDDTEYFTRVVLRSRKIVFCPEARGYYRSGNSSLSGRRSRAALDSFFQSCELCTRELLSFEDSGRTRHACASLWRHFAYWTYPDAADLVRLAEAKAESLGGSALTLEGSPHFNWVRGLLGWKAARRIQRAYYRVRYS